MTVIQLTFTAGNVLKSIQYDNIVTYNLLLVI
ncbi:hypothetical protein J2Z66_008739 [Paenibacillus eucommiae]|uniref:Uncharacterized protein n=1 Tax=Paenibacillus eucommiae TaxID=1355755 RepID=A0ABS4JD98_9BACL|nr:hypothetical protein [Paenibacillus eucommiae]